METEQNYCLGEKQDSNFTNNTIFVYSANILLMLSIIGPAAYYQATNYYGFNHPEFFVMPLLVAVTIGSLLGRTALLKKSLHRQKEQFRTIVELAEEFTYYQKLDGSYEYVSPACTTLTGYSQAEFYSVPNLMDLLIHPDDKIRWRQYKQGLAKSQKKYQCEIRLISRNDDTIWIRHTSAPVNDKHGSLIGARSTNLDITARKQHEDKIKGMLYTDTLTGLINRHSLSKHISEHINNPRTAGEGFTLLFLDLKRFKHINDSFGHSFGDRLLEYIAQRLKHTLSKDFMLARFGGDEFALLAKSCNTKEQALELAENILRVVEQPIELEGNELHISACVGITLYPEDGSEEEALICNADVALHRAKRQSSSNIRFYSTSFINEAAHFVSTEGKIQKGLINNEFIPYYQPKVNLCTGKLIGFEALARWHHPQEGTISPAEFIPVAEETGQINELGRQIMSQVLTDVYHWQEAGIALPVAVNISARQFASHGYYSELVEQFNSYGCARTLIELEITEQVFLGDIDYALERLKKIKSIGLSIALDDFGTGYSSLSYIKNLPIDTLKIDRSFISNIHNDNKEYAIMRSIMSMCSELKLDIVVEGIETEAQKEALLSLGCSKAQGYFYYPPITAAEAEALLLEQSQLG